MEVFFPKKSSDGFTLIELMVVIAVLAITVMVAVPSMR
ncbi:MAG: prepilin-type cleavage/methylation domain-containing protein, partial [Epsilonproteobacteria bacterium]